MALMRTLLVVIALVHLVATETNEHQQPAVTLTEQVAGRGHLNVTKTSPLAKFVLLFSRPGAFAKEAQAAFGTEFNTTSIESACPSGEEGLECRRREARKGADECGGGGSCLSCHDCDAAPVLDWPRCCKKNFLCCNQLASACQRCDHQELAPFCAKRFKRCF